ncbi:hypothetical protein DCCM_0552 [Desulfocucumis palustris]|uniref:Uncharacterized protein n=1 Tax=Desulfocucumis palustris TaxID=1898651 RepID=A0A2L2X8C8_9FIRM|nr:hypothetical protein [Desulfocucumis palustris]GBF32358.1 hypothetical protein DCCM_0552 [Desulfocucumis palustris]
MSNIVKELELLFASDVFQSLISSDVIKLNQLNAAIAVLIKLGIPFDLAFSPGTRRLAAALELDIFINPTTTVNFVINLEAGPSIFG